MTARVYRSGCPRCGRPTPKKRLRQTAAGPMCVRCVERLPRRLRKPTEEKNDD